MKKQISTAVLALSLAFSATASADWFNWFDNNNNNAPWDDNDWPEWTPMYWMEEMSDEFDNNDDQYRQPYYNQRGYRTTPPGYRTSPNFRPQAAPAPSFRAPASRPQMNNNQGQNTNRAPQPQMNNNQNQNFNRTPRANNGQNFNRQPMPPRPQMRRN